MNAGNNDTEIDLRRLSARKALRNLENILNSTRRENKRLRRLHSKKARRGCKGSLIAFRARRVLNYGSGLG
jgi:hypothetical protein